MKKIILILSLGMSLNAFADDILGFPNFFDLNQIGQTLLNVADNVNNQLEKLRLIQNKNLPIQQQWDLACETTQSLNQSIVALNKQLSKYKVSQKTCTPISAVLNLQNEVIKNCQNFYSKPVPANAETLINKVSASILQSRLILTKCYPSLSQIKIPGLP